MTPKQGGRHVDNLMTVVLMSRPEAEAITKDILDANEAAWALVYRAYQGEAWRAMGYKSWAAYVDAELQISRGHSYQLLNQAKQQEKLTAAAPEAGQINNWQARTMRKDPEAVIAAVKSGASIGEAVEVVRAAAPVKKHARQGPRGLDGECERIARGMETLNEQFELAGDDALDYLDFETRRTFERTVDRMTDFCATWGERLQRPANPRAADDGEAA